ncbi:MAG: efflux RND transporter periplasmic adaptor subunit [Burkholderiaceae bacterium]|nr:efflux RND transporter periplasmic adaptor subunit [Burkholderiaceae bacterium]MBX3615166.1 efflux RND transporter periplasmic adaptor subunit [Burkholderiaceae bacterium]
MTSSLSLSRVLIPALALVLAAATAGCSRSEPSRESAADTASKPAGGSPEGDEHGAAGRVGLSPEELRTAGVKVEPLKLRSVVDQVVLTATIRANQDRIAHVAPRVPARVVNVKAKLGDHVRAGQTLALLDSIELGEAHAVYRQAQSQFALASADLERAQKLQADQIIPEKDYLRARAEYEKARASLRASTDRLRLLDATHRDTERDPPSILAVRAPFDGTVVEKHAILGELAQPDKPIFVVADLSSLWIEANLFEKDLARIRIGAPAVVTVAAYPGETFSGKLTYISSTVDRETRVVPARVEVPNADGRLKPEMFATAFVDTAASAQALILPREAVLLVNGQPTVFVEEGDGFEARAVELGGSVGGGVVVRSGLREGEPVVVSGAYAIKARLLKSQIGDAH